MLPVRIGVSVTRASSDRHEIGRGLYMAPCISMHGKGEEPDQTQQENQQVA